MAATLHNATCFYLMISIFLTYNIIKIKKYYIVRKLLFVIKLPLVETIQKKTETRSAVGIVWVSSARSSGDKISGGAPSIYPVYL